MCVFSCFFLIKLLPFSTSVSIWWIPGAKLFILRHAIISDNYSREIGIDFTAPVNHHFIFYILNILLCLWWNNTWMDGLWNVFLHFLHTKRQLKEKHTNFCFQLRVELKETNSSLDSPGICSSTAAAAPAFLQLSSNLTTSSNNHYPCLTRWHDTNPLYLQKKKKRKRKTEKKEKQPL